MRFPSDSVLSGLWKALNAADATPAGGDFDEEGLNDVAAAINWLQRECEQAATRTRKLAQPSEPVTKVFRMVTCDVHRSIHRERTTCVRPRDDAPDGVRRGR
jgi:hypothetical protein